MRNFLPSLVYFMFCVFSLYGWLLRSLVFFSMNWCMTLIRVSSPFYVYNLKVWSFLAFHISCMSPSFFCILHSYCLPVWSVYSASYPSPDTLSSAWFIVLVFKDSPWIFLLGYSVLQSYLYFSLSALQCSYLFNKLSF